MTDLELAYEALKRKQHWYDVLWDYYDGRQPLRYSTNRLRELFRAIDVRFVENWCAVVVDAVQDRINLKQWQVDGDQSMSDELGRLVKASGITLDADDVHLATLVCGEAFVIVWPDDSRQPQAYYNDPRLCHVVYEAENPRRARFAAKWWVGDDERRYLTLYYPKHLEYYVSRGKAENVHYAAAFQPREPEWAVNPYEAIPVFHFRRERRIIKSELANVISLQDAVNKLLADMMVTAEFAAFPERYAVTNADLSQLKSAPNEMMEIPKGSKEEEETQIGQFPAADLANYLTAIDKLAMAIAIISRTPKHYLMAQGGDPSGEALIAMEGPLNKKCDDLIEQLSPIWSQIGAFLLRVAGRETTKEVIARFHDPAMVQPRAEAEIAKLKRDTALLDHELGVSRETILTDLGYDAADEMKKREAEGGDMAETMLTAFDRDANA